MTKNLSFSIALLFALASCKKNEKADVLLDKSAITDSSTIQPAKSIVNAPVQTIVPVGNLQKGNEIPGQKIITIKQNKIATAPGMNPPHGQPGHRCEIPIGAPLSSAPPKSSTVQTVNVQSTNQNTAQNIKVAPGINPPHGQPKHRCDIPVGAPLNSPAATAPTTIQNSVQKQQPKALPATVAAPQVADNTVLAGTKPTTNPAHGQPFHRCDIAVRAALP